MDMKKSSMFKAALLPEIFRNVKLPRWWSVEGDRLIVLTRDNNWVIMDIEDWFNKTFAAFGHANFRYSDPKNKALFKQLIGARFNRLLDGEPSLTGRADRTDNFTAIFDEIVAEMNELGVRFQTADIWAALPKHRPFKYLSGRGTLRPQTALKEILPPAEALAAAQDNLVSQR